MVRSVARAAINFNDTTGDIPFPGNDIWVFVTRLSTKYPDADNYTDDNYNLAIMDLTIPALESGTTNHIRDEIIARLPDGARQNGATPLFLNVLKDVTAGDRGETHYQIHLALGQSNNTYGSGGPFFAGDAVQDVGVSPPHAGRVEQVNDDGTYQVRFSDGLMTRRGADLELIIPAMSKAHPEALIAASVIPLIIVFAVATILIAITFKLTGVLSIFSRPPAKVPVTGPDGKMAFVDNKDGTVHFFDQDPGSGYTPLQVKVPGGGTSVAENLAKYALYGVAAFVGIKLIEAWKTGRSRT